MAAFAAIRASNPRAALTALEQSSLVGGRVGATARWARRAIWRGVTAKDTARVIATIRWALERMDAAA